MPRGAWYEALREAWTGRPLPRALMDVWQADDAGFYDTQQPDRVPEGNLRGLFSANTAGEFWFRTIVPSCYPIPDDGPAGRLSRATHRHPNHPWTSISSPAQKVLPRWSPTCSSREAPIWTTTPCSG